MMRKEDRLPTRTRLAVAMGIIALLILSGVGFVAVALPKLVNTPEFRAALAARAGQALGTPVEWKNLGIGFFPPRVVIEAPVLVGQGVSREAAASVRAEAIDLRLSLLPLLQRRIAIESLVLHGVELIVSRTPEGFVLPDLGGGASDAEDAASDPNAAGAGSEAGGTSFVLDLRELRVENGRVLVHDQTLSPPVDWRLDELSLRARGPSLDEPLDEPLDVELTAHLFSNDRELGTLSGAGKLDRDGEYDLGFELEHVQVAALSTFLPDPQVVSGELSGQLSVAGKRSALSRLTTDLDIAGLRLRTRGVELVGELELRAQRKSEAAIAFEAVWSAAESGGGAKITGERTSSGDLALTALLEQLELAPFAPLAGADRSIAGRATGEVSLETDAGELDRVETDLAIESARYADGRIDAKGKLDLALGLEGLESQDPVRIQAVFAPESGGRVDVNGTGTVAGAVRGALRFDAFDVSLVAPLLPQDTQVSGKLTGEVELETTAERELARLASHLRIGAARVVRAPVDVAGDLTLTARIDGDGPIELDAKAALADGGRVELVGTSTRKGVLDLKAELSNFDLAAATPFVASPDLALAGRATGHGRLAGAYDALDSLALDLEIAGAALRMSDTRIDGPLAVELDVANPFAKERRGTVDLDLTLSEVAVGESFKKPAGVRAELATKFSGDPSGGLAFESRGELNNINELLLRGAIGGKTSVAITSSSFDLKGWSGLVPSLAAHEPAGVVAFEGFSLERREGAKDRFGGRIALRTVDLSLPGAGRVRLRGNLVGAGERIEANALSATIHGLTLAIDGRVNDPLVDAKFELAAHSVGEAEANDLISGLTSARDTVFGALRFDSKLAGMAGGEASLYDTLTGSVRFTIGESGGGRLRGVSLLRTTLGQIPLLGGATRLAQKLRAQPAEPDYLGEEFELIEGDLAIAAGEIDARTLRIRYRGYEARLTGRMHLAGLALDMRGELLLDSPLVALLAGRPASELAGRPPVRIPLARVTNTLSDPKVSLTVETLAAVPKLLFLTTGVDQMLGQAVGNVLGKVGDKIGGVVGKSGGNQGGKVADEVGQVAETPRSGEVAAAAAEPVTEPVAEGTGGVEEPVRGVEAAANSAGEAVGEAASSEDAGDRPASGALEAPSDGGSP